MAEREIFLFQITTKTTSALKAETSLLGGKNCFHEGENWFHEGKNWLNESLCWFLQEVSKQDDEKDQGGKKCGQRVGSFQGKDQGGQQY